MTYFIIIVMLVWVWIAWELSRAPYIDKDGNIKKD